MKDNLIIFGAKYLFLTVLVVAAITYWKLGRKKGNQFILSLVIAGALAGVLVKILGKLYFDPRPFVSGHIKPLVTHTADNGFPSEHTAYSATIAAVIYCYRKKFGLIAGLVAVVVGVSRVAAHVHSPVDIIAALAIGVVTGWAGFWLASRLMGDKTKP